MRLKVAWRQALKLAESRVSGYYEQSSSAPEDNSL